MDYEYDSHKLPATLLTPEDTDEEANEHRKFMIAMWKSYIRNLEEEASFFLEQGVITEVEAVLQAIKLHENNIKEYEEQLNGH